MTVKALPITERAFMEQILELATYRGWESLHLRPAMTRRGWVTPVQGTMGVGFPDLMLVRDGRLVFMEVKSEKGRVSPAQASVREVLKPIAPCYVVRPSDWDFIERELA
jgi:hypothetical protein